MNTKTLLPLLLAALLTAGTAFTSCKKATPAETATVADTLTVTADSIVFAQPTESGQTALTFRFVVDKPVGGTYKALTDSLLARLIATDSLAVCDSLKAGMMAIADTFRHYATLNDGTVPYSYDGTIRLCHQSSRYATFVLSTYEYLGGAHGNSMKRNVTIAFEEGKALGWDDIFTSEGKQQLLTLLDEALREQYYKDNTPGYEAVDGIFSLKLPAAAPAFLPEGIAFWWGDYEIDAHAAGLPHCVIPYAKVAQYLQPAAQALIED